MTNTIRAGFLALFAFGAVQLSASQGYACDVGYYRFIDNNPTVAADWQASQGEITAQGGGISVFMDLSQVQYQTMAEAREETTPYSNIVALLPCDALIAPLTYTADQTNLNDWTQAGGDNHGLISVTGATRGRDFNRSIHVDGQRAPNYLAGASAVIYPED